MIRLSVKTCSLVAGLALAGCASHSWEDGKCMNIQTGDAYPARALLLNHKVSRWEFTDKSGFERRLEHNDPDVDQWLCFITKGDKQ